MKKDKYTCQRCGAPAEEVHHLTYARIFKERSGDLISLCVKCHKKAHDK